MLCGGSLRPVDVQLMKQLQTQVNIVPVIAKADTLTSTEVKRLKAQVHRAKHRLFGVYLTSASLVDNIQIAVM